MRRYGEAHCKSFKAVALWEIGIVFTLGPRRKQQTGSHEMASADPREPLRSFNFHVDIDGVPVGTFSEVSGLTAEGDAIESR
jgi:hypothetical protein